MLYLLSADVYHAYKPWIYFIWTSVLGHDLLNLKSNHDDILFIFIFLGNFSYLEIFLVKYAGAAAMYFVSKKLKKKYNITDERAALYEAAETWVDALDGREFLGMYSTVVLRRLYYQCKSIHSLSLCVCVTVYKTEVSDISKCSSKCLEQLFSRETIAFSLKFSQEVDLKESNYFSKISWTRCSNFILWFFFCQAKE